MNRGHAMFSTRYAAGAALMLLAAPARGAIVQTYADATAFAAAGTIALAPLGSPGNPTTFFPTYDFGNLSIAGRDGDLAGSGVLISTELDSDRLILKFARPVSAVSILGLVSDAAFAAIGGTLRISVAGQDGIDLAVTNLGSSFLGFRTDTPFKRLTIDVASYDVDASSVAFATLDTEVGAVFAPVAEPSGFALLIGGAALVARRRRSVQAS